MSTQNDFAPSVDFLKVIPDVWAGRWLILGATLAAGVIGGVIAFAMPERYEASAGLLLMPPPFKETKDELTSMIPKVLSVPDYEIMLKSDGVLSQAVKKVKEEAAGPKKDIWPEDDLALLDELSRVRGRMFVTTEVTEKSVTVTKYSPVIVLTARAGTPEQAAHLAQAWADVSETLAMTLYDKGKTGLTDFMRSSFEDTREMLTEVNRQIRDVEIEWNDELENARILKKHTRHLDYEEKIEDTDMKIAALSEEIASMEADLANEPEKVMLWKSPPMESVFMGQALGKKAQPGKETADGEVQFGYKEEMVNPINFELRQKLAGKRAELASAKEFNRRMREEQARLGAELQDLRREGAVRNYERRLLDIQVTPLQLAYDTLSEKLQQAKVAETEQGSLADIKIMADAVPPDRKSFPPRSLIVLASMVLAGAGALAFVVLRGLLLRAGVRFT